MKSVTVHHSLSIRADIWRLDRGDKIERHRHAFMHSTGVFQGRTKVTLFRPSVLGETVAGGDESWEMTPGDRDFAFPPQIEHEIEAIEDGTIVVNMSHAIVREPPPPSKPGGLMLETGEVIYHA
jgi:quercetin dioxygenase-like cupin family protein